jgi:hypothetical protein
MTDDELGIVKNSEDRLVKLVRVSGAISRIK